MPDRTSRPKILWVGLNSSGIQASKMTEQSAKLKLYVAFVKLNLAITEAARLSVITLMQSVVANSKS